MNLGENIYKYRSKKNMSQGDLADALEVSRQSVSKWENNNAVPELEKLVKMSQIFGITLDELVSGEKAPPKPQVSSADKHRFSRREIVGILFLGCALLIVLTYMLSGEQLAGMLPALPFILAGCLCFTNVRHLPLWCIWALCLPLVFTSFTSYIRYDISRWITPVLYLFLLAATLYVLRNDPVPMTKKTAVLLLLGYISWFAWFADRIIMHFRIQAHNDPSTFLYYPHWKTALGFVLFTTLLSVTTRLLKKK